MNIVLIVEEEKEQRKRETERVRFCMKRKYATDSFEDYQTFFSQDGFEILRPVTVQICGSLAQLGR